MGFRPLYNGHMTPLYWVRPPPTEGTDPPTRAPDLPIMGTVPTYNGYVAPQKYSSDPSMLGTPPLCQVLFKCKKKKNPAVFVESQPDFVA